MICSHSKETATTDKPHLYLSESSSLFPNKPPTGDRASLMNRAPLIILGVLVVGSAGFGLYQLDQVRKLNQNAAAWDNERAALQKRIRELQQRNGEPERPASALPRAEAGPLVEGARGPRPRASEPVPGGDTPAARFRGRPDNNRLGAMMASPEMQKLMAVQQKSALDGHYAALFKQLQLSPADLEKFKNLLVDKQASVMDVMAAARSEGLGGREDRDQVRQLVQDARAEVDDNIRSVLGDAAYAQYQNFEATQPQRSVVNQLEQRLSYSPTPLTDSQSRQLVQILADTSAAAAGQAGQMMATATFMPVPGGRAGGVTITDDAITRAQGILSAQQVSAMQALQQEQQAGALLMKQMRSNFQGPTPASGTNSPARTAGPTSVVPKP